MKDNYTEIVVVLDRSGSMNSIWKDAIGGLNSFVEDQKKLKGKCKFTLVAFDDIDRAMLLEEIDRAMSTPPAVDHIEMLREALRRSTGSVLYLNDNAGEIVFDRLVVEQMLAAGIAAERITAMVRGGPAINDALYEDAVTAGLADLVEVTDSGIDAPGMLLELASPEAVERYQAADVVIAKGQGNLESLPVDDARVFFLLRVKCPVLSRVIDLERGSQVAVRGGTTYIGGVD